MYSVVLATMLTASTASPAWCGGCWGCKGCSGCHSCWACGGCGCGGCWGCYGCGGCYGCFGCGGCYGCSGCWGCGGCGGYGCYGCYGCGCGVVVNAQPAAKPDKKQEDKKGTNLPGSATIVVTAAPDARVTVDGDPINLTTGSQAFRTPDLEPGQEYYYTFKAEAVRDGKKVTESRRISFRAGETARVEFPNLNAPAVAAAR